MFWKPGRYALDCSEALSIRGPLVDAVASLVSRPEAPNGSRQASQVDVVRPVESEAFRILVHRGYNATVFVENVKDFSDQFSRRNSDVSRVPWKIVA